MRTPFLSKLLLLLLSFTAPQAQAQLRATYSVTLESRYFWTNDGDQCSGPDARWIFWIQDNVDGNRLGQSGTFANDNVGNNQDLTFSTNHGFGSRTNTATRIDPWLNCWEEDDASGDEGRTGDRDIADINFRDEDGGYNTSVRYPGSGEYRTSVSDGGSFRYGGVYRVTWRYAETCPAPGGVTATDANANDITVSWSAANQAERYDVYRNTSNNSGTASLIGNTTGTSYVDTGISRGTTYFYWVRAYREGSNSLVKSDTLSGFSATDSGIQPKLNQTITFGALGARTYGDAAFSLGATASSGLSVSYTSSNAAVATVSGNTVTITGPGTTTITASQGGNGNYNAASNVDQSLSVAAKALTVASPAVTSKVYDGNTAATITGMLAGVIGGDTVTLNGTGTFNNASVGSGKPVTSTSTLGGASAGNYTLTQPTGLTGTISPKSVTVTANAAGKVYGETDPALTYAASGLLGGDALTGALQRVAGENAGSYDINQGSLAAGANYTIAYTGAPFTISARALTVTATPVVKFVGEVLSATSGSTAFTASGLVNGESIGSVSLTFGSGAEAEAAAGNYPGQVFVSGATGGTFDPANYNITYVPGDILVTPLPAVSVTGSFAASTGEYGSPSAPAVSVTVSAINLKSALLLTAPQGFEISSAPGSGFASTLSLQPVNGVVTSTSVYLRLSGTAQAGTYSGEVTITSTALDPVSIPVAGSSVNPKPLQITGLSGATRVYDATVQATLQGTPAYDGLVNGDAFPVAGTPTASFVTKDAGMDKAVTVSGFTDPSANYSVVQPQSVTGTVTPKPVTVQNPQVADRAYDGTVDVTFTGPLDGVLEGDEVLLIGTATFASADAGTDKPVTANGSLSGAQAGNYSLVQPEGLVATITIKTLRITANPAVKTFGSADPALTYLTNGLVGDDAVTGTLARDAGEDVGSYAINLGSLTASANYEIEFAGSTLEVEPKVVTVTANPQSKLYGAADPTFTYTSSGLLEGDALTGSLSRQAGEGIGSYEITLGSLSAGTNYTIDFTAANLVIASKALTLTNASVVTKLYDGTTAARITGTLEGGVPGDQVTLSGNGIFASAEPGTGIAVTATVTLEGADATNYAVEQPQGLSGTILAGDIAFAPALYTAGQDDASVTLTLVRASDLPETSVTIRTDDGMASTETPIVAAVAGTDYVDLEGTPGATAFFLEGQTSQTVTIQLVPQAGEATNRQFTATIVSTTGGKIGTVSAATIRILANDAEDPALAVLVPSTDNATIVDTLPYLVSGTISDNQGVDRVTLALNGQAPIELTLTPSAQSNSFTWQASIEPGNGANTITVTAYDLKGNQSIVTRSFEFDRARLLDVTLTGPAGVSASSLGNVAISAPNAAVLSSPPSAKVVPGSLVRLTATARPGYAFVRWQDPPTGATVLANTLEFTMPDGELTVEAQFGTNEVFSGPAGSGTTFRGLVLPAEGTPASNATAGFMQLSLDRVSGVISGTLTIDGAAQRFSGFVLGDGGLYFSNPLRTALPVGGRELTLSYNAGEEKDAIAVNLTDGAVTSTGIARRDVYSTGKLVDAALLNTPVVAGGAPVRGVYNVALLSKEQSPPRDLASYPQGDGYLTLTLTNTGSVTGSGVLADGTPLSVSSALVAGDQCPLFVQLQTPGQASTVRGAAFLGNLVFDPAQANTDVVGANFLWFRPDVSTLTPVNSAASIAAASLYTRGWPTGIAMDVIGALYNNALTLQAGIDLDGPTTTAEGVTLTYEDGKLVFSEGKLTAAITKQNFVVSGNTVSKLPATDTSFTLVPSVTAGTFTGTFKPNWAPLASTNPSFRGILLQKGNLKGGYGFFQSNLSADSAPQVGGVRLTLEPFADAQSPISFTIPTTVSATAPYTITGTGGDLRGVARVEVTVNGDGPVIATLGAPTAGAVSYSAVIEPRMGMNTVIVTMIDSRGNRSSTTVTFNFLQRFPLAIERLVPVGVSVDSAGSVAITASPSSQATSLAPVTANANPRTANVQHGTSVTITATPKPGYAFVRWTGLPASAVALGPVATFSMPTSNLEVAAEFAVASAIFGGSNGAGTGFYGLILPEPGTPTGNDTAGFLSGSLNVATGSFTGSLLVDGRSHSVTATFFGDGSASFSAGSVRQNFITLAGRTLTLSYNAGAGNDAITASLTNGTATSSGVARRAIYSATNLVPAALLNTASVANGPINRGAFTVAFPAKAQTPVIDTASYPQGDGYVTLTLTNAGLVTGSGFLADGSALSVTSALVSGNQCPIFAQITTPGQAATVRGGSFFGTLVFDTTQVDTDVAATDLTWIRPDVTSLTPGTTAVAIAAANRYTAGWPNGIKVDAIGALYDKAKTIQVGIDLDGTSTDENGNTLTYEDGKLVFSSGKLNGDITKQNFIVAGNTVTKIPTTDTTFTLTATASTGAISGSFRPNWTPLATANPVFSGVLLQKGANKGGHGYFLSNSTGDTDPESGDVNLTLEPLIGATAPVASTTPATVSATAPYTMSGTAGNARGVARVEVVLNGGDPVNASLGAPSATGTVAYNAVVTPVLGNNIAVITVVDLRGNRTSTTVNFVFNQRFQLTLSRTAPDGVTLDAAGTVAMTASPAAQASTLSGGTANVQHGTAIVLTATPKAGYAFVRWTGLPMSATVTGNVASFSMPTSSLSITAEFATSASVFAGATGTGTGFFGLIRPAEGTATSNATVGFLSGTLNAATGAFTGSVLADGITQAVSATFYGNGEAIFGAGATRSGSLSFGGRTLSLSLNTSGAKDQITATLTTPAGTSTGVAKRAIYSATNAFASNSTYTVALPSKAQDPAVDTATYPQGDGYGTITLTSAGGITFAITLADGTICSATTALVEGNEAPFFGQILTPGSTTARGGSLSGTLKLDLTQADSDLTGADLLWFRPTVTQQTGTTPTALATQLYTAGWPTGIKVDAVGARYDNTRTVQASLGLATVNTVNPVNGKLQFADGKLTAGITKTNFNINGSTVTKIPATDTSFTLTTTATTGAFTGTIRPNWTPTATALPAFKGIILQKGANQGGFGFFLSNIPNDLDPQSGGVSLTKP